MSEFKTPVKLEMLDHMRYRLLAPVIYHVGSYPSHWVLTVPAGTITDLATIPRFLWSWLQPDGPYAKAAILHDWLYQTGQYPRQQADAIFYEAMSVLGVHPFKAWLMYRVVRCFGGRYYHRK